MYWSDPPNSKNERNVNSPSFQPRHINFSENNVINKSIGLTGELLVLEREKQYLIENGRRDLADKVWHTSIIEGDGAGFDIQSYFLDGKLKFIEVKTTTSNINTSFFITSNELAFSKEFSDSYRLYRVFNFNNDKKTGDYFILKGALTDNTTLIPTQYKAYHN